MTPLRFHVVPRADIQRHFPLPVGTIQDYEALRPDVLHDRTQDIFAPNSRSARQRWKNFSLFEQVESPEEAEFLVCQNWLELALQAGERRFIGGILEFLRDYAGDKPCVVSWNHDTDEATLPEFRSLPPNFVVLSYNTSHPTPNDLLLPFWNVATELDWQPEVERPLHGGFIGFVGKLTARLNVMRAFHGGDGWQVLDTHSQRVEHGEYLRRMTTWDFALCPRGGGLNSYRTFEALQSGAIPVVFADDYSWPYPDVDWGTIIVQIPERDAGNFNLVWDILGSMDVVKRRQRIQELRERCSLAGVQEAIAARLRELLT